MRLKITCLYSVCEGGGDLSSDALNMPITFRHHTEPTVPICLSNPKKTRQEGTVCKGAHSWHRFL
jgi:hypothetical protein